MEKVIIVAALVCQPGERLIDPSGKLPRGLQFMDLVSFGRAILCPVLYLSTGIP
jgi:hypothetical protein